MPSAKKRETNRWRLRLVHALRIYVLIGIVVCIHLQHRKLSRRTAQNASEIRLETVKDAFPGLFAGASSLELLDSESRMTTVVQDDDAIGYVVQTSPDSDHIRGFSGPTNVLIALDSDLQIAGLKILSSGDTRDHVDQIQDDPGFLQSLNGKSWEEATTGSPDAVSGATLTSYAILESIAVRLGVEQPSLKFPEQITVDDLKSIFPDADSVVADKNFVSRFQVLQDGKQIGSVISTSPPADNYIGELDADGYRKWVPYQGPTRTLIALDIDEKITGLIIGKSYDNEPYVGYVCDEDYFLNLFNELSIPELIELDLEEYQVEGVSGATITSMAVARCIQIAAAANQNPKPVVEKKQTSWISVQAQDFGTIGVLLFGMLFAFTSLRGKKWLRVLFQLVVIVYLGFMNGALISQVMLVGWAQNGVPFRSAIGLVLLTFAAFVIPITTKNNIYCSHLCPHGAIQQLTKNRLRHVRLSHRVHKILLLIPAVLLLLVITVVMFQLPINLVDIEPFDAYLFRIAGWATIVIAIVGLVASLFVPMAYCRFGCPTGALISYTRFHARADKLGPRDWFAGLILAGCLAILLAT